MEYEAANAERLPRNQPAHYNQQHTKQCWDHQEQAFKDVDQHGLFAPPRVDHPGFAGGIGGHGAGLAQPPAVVHHAVRASRPLGD